MLSTTFNLKRLLVASGAVLFVALSVWLGSSLVPFSRGYEVKGVPYAGIRGTHSQEFLYTENNKKVRAINIGSPASATVMVAGFWHLQDPSQPLVLPNDANGKLYKHNQGITLESIANYARELGFNARIRPAPLGVWTLGLYSNPSRPTPLIVEQDLDEAYPGKGRVFRVVVGSTRAGEVTVHDYIYGPAHKLSRADFNQLWRKPKRILIIEPKDRQVADAAKPKFDYKKDYPDDAKFAEIRTLWYLAEEARDNKQRAEAAGYWERVLNHQLFAELPLVQRLYNANSLLFQYQHEKRFSDIVALESKVLPLITSKVHPQVATSTLVLLGEGYLGIGDNAKAKSYAEKALAIDAKHNAALALLEKAK